MEEGYGSNLLPYVLSHYFYISPISATVSFLGETHDWDILVVLLYMLFEGNNSKEGPRGDWWVSIFE